jgi:hypothetical protein
LSARPAVPREVRRRDLALAGVLAVVFGAAPTVGDIGSCGQVATDLDEQSFAAARKQIDCQRCTGCGLTTQTCRNACDPTAPSNVGWPSTCHPLAHDGDVCLRALAAAGCGDYAAFVDDVAPTLPTECDFCHLVPPAPAAGDP